MEEEDREPEEEEREAAVIHLLPLKDGVRLTAQVECDDPEMQARLNRLLQETLHKEPPDDG